MKNGFGSVAVALCFACSVFGQAAESSDTSPWRVNLGASARVGMKTKIAGNGNAENGYVNPDPGGGSTTFDWGADSAGQVVQSGGNYYLDLGRGGNLSEKADDDCMPGFTVSAARNFFAAGAFKFGVRVGFSGYWGMEEKFSSQAYTDRYDFDAMAPLFWGGTAWTPGGNYYSSLDGMWYDAGGNLIPSVFVDPSSSSIRSTTRVSMKSALYQLSAGPAIEWAPTERFYVSLVPALLLNLADTEVNYQQQLVGGATVSASSQSTKALLGGGAYLQSGYLFADNWGLYGSVGYEYIDSESVSCGPVRVETDYSSVVFSLGVEYRF